MNSVVQLDLLSGATPRRSPDTKFRSGRQNMPAGPGRPKGSRNLRNYQLREMILRALDEVGGVEYLKEQALYNPNAFMALLARVLPTTLSGDKNAPLQILEIKRVIVDPKERCDEIVVD